jgi:hypothetical protein
MPLQPNQAAGMALDDLDRVIFRAVVDYYYFEIAVLRRSGRREAGSYGVSAVAIRDNDRDEAFHGRGLVVADY